MGSERQINLRALRRPGTYNGMSTAPRVFWSDPEKTAMERLAYTDGVMVSLQ